MKRNLVSQKNSKAWGRDRKPNPNQTDAGSIDLIRTGRFRGGVLDESFR